MSGAAISAARIWLKLSLKTLLALPGWLMRGRPSVRVLFYHRVNPYPFAALGPVSREVTVRPVDFAWQMNYLAAKGYRAIPLAEFEQIVAGKRPADPRCVLITFDDGYEDNLLFAAPVLRAAGNPAVVFAVADFLGRTTAEVWPDADPPRFGRLLDPAQLQALEADGVQVSSHTATHPLLTTLAPEELARELAGARAQLESLLGHPVTALAYPGGDFDDAVMDAARAAGYRTAFTTQTGALGEDFRPLALRRTEVSASDSRFVFRMKLAGALDWLAIKDSAPFRRAIARANRMLLPLVRAKA